jgi:hypothetical protein
VAEDPGFLLVQAGLVRDDQLLTAREARAQGGGTLGEHLVLAGVVDDDALTDFYAARLVIPRVAPDELARIPASVLRRIPADMAAEFRVVPIASDGELNLTLAMSDPADKHVVDEVAFFTGTYVVRAVATQLQIAWCLAHYYGVMTPLARARLVPSDAAGSTGSGPISDATPWQVEEEEETGPARMPIARKKPVQRRGSDLAPRSGTLDVSPAPREPERLPAVVVDDEELTGQRSFAGTDAGDTAADAEDGDRYDSDTDPGDEARTIVRRPPTEQPILLDRPRRRSSVVRAPTGSGEILLLDQIKGGPRLPSSQTEPGLGQLGSVDSAAQARHDTEASRGTSRAENAGDSDPVSRRSKADRRGRRSRGQPAEPAHADEPTTDSNGVEAAIRQDEVVVTPRPEEGGTPELPPLDARGDSDDPAEATTDPGEVTTEPMRHMNGTPNGNSTGSASRGSNARTDVSVDDGWDVDDGWGPPGSTIPPAYMGARAVSEDDDEESQPGRSPALASVPAPLDGAALPAAAQPEVEVDPAVVAAELERSSNRLLETLRGLERAPGRDEVVDLLLDHLGSSLRRRAFFAVKGGVLFSFRQQGAAVPGIGVAEIALDQPSTFGQVAQSRVPYRGGLTPAAAEFVERALGSRPGHGEVVVVPVAVRGKAVGLLYGDGLTARLFDEHQAVLGKAAGQALERILASRAAKG